MIYLFCAFILLLKMWKDMIRMIRRWYMLASESVLLKEFICFSSSNTALGSGLFSQPAQTPAQSNQLINTASALSAPTLLGDERDAILAKWNQLQAFWGTGKGYFNNNIAPVEFTQENPFCRFKVWSCSTAHKQFWGSYSACWVSECLMSVESDFVTVKSILKQYFSR